MRYQTIFDIAGKDNLWMIFFSIVGVIYAITIAFLLIIVLEKFNRFSTTVSDEVNLIQDIRDFLIFIKTTPNIQKELYFSLLAHAKNTYTIEWEKIKKFSNNKVAIESDTSSYLYEVIKNVAKLEPKSYTGKMAVKEIISKIGDITTIRTKRIELSQNTLSPLLYFYLQFMGAMLTVPFMLFNGGNIYMQSGMIFAVVAAIKILYEIVKDFDNPLSGFWNVNMSAMEVFCKKETDKDLEKMFFENSLINHSSY